MQELPEINVPSELLRETLSWAKTILCAVIFALLINNFVIVNASVPTGSMKETIMENDRIVAFRLSYLLAQPRRYDVVVFRYPDDESVPYVKRIIGLPGETLEIRNGKVYIDGSDRPLDDYFTVRSEHGDFGPVTVPEGHYFMLGDNRGNSQDSRYWENTNVAKNKILGKVLFKYYPNMKILLGI